MINCAQDHCQYCPTGSTTPDSTPPRNALFLFSPSALSGMDMIAPSGKF